MRKPSVGRYVGRSANSSLTDLPTYRLTDFWSRFRAAFKQVVGMPDYARYLEHHAVRHPECAVPSEREFYEQYLEARYGNGASRCC